MPNFRSQSGDEGLVGIGVLAPPFHPSQNGYEPVLIDAVTHPSIDRNGISPPLQLKREERCAADVFHLMQLLVQTCFKPYA